MENSLPVLPNDILEQIFGHLSVFQLNRARLVCRTWNDTICGSETLRDRFVFLLNAHVNCGKGCSNCVALRNARDRLRNVKVRYTVLGDWSLICSHLQRLTLEACYGVKAEAMIDVFRSLQNLHSLKLDTVTIDDFKLSNVKLDFKQENLKELSIVNGQVPVKFLYILKKICLNLVVLEIIDCFHWSSFTNHCNEQLFKLVYAVRNTLERLSLSYRNIQGSLLEEICSIDRLELKSFSLLRCDKLKDHHIAHLSRMQPGLEELEVKTMLFNNEQVLVEICRNLANIKTLKLETIQPCGPSWLSHLPYLGHLKLNNWCSELNHYDASLPNLRILSLKYVKFSRGSLPNLFKNLPNLQKLSLTSCDLQHVPEFLPSLNYLKNLQFLKLDSIYNYFDQFLKKTPVQVTNLRHLELINVVPNNPLSALSQQSPHLAIIHLERTNTGDRQLQLTCRALTHLKEMSLRELTQVTGSFVEFVCVHRGSLQQIRVVHCARIRYAEKNRLSTLMGKVHVLFD